jgi:hypothetical protein
MFSSDAPTRRHKLHVDLLVFGRAGPAQPRRLVAEFLAAWPTYEDY